MSHPSAVCNVLCIQLWLVCVVCWRWILC